MYLVLNRQPDLPQPKGPWVERMGDSVPLAGSAAEAIVDGIPCLANVGARQAGRPVGSWR
jgi:hypothetical protein